MSKEKSDSIKEAYESNESSKRKKIRSSNYQDFDLTVFEWFKQNRSLNIQINGPILFKKAEQFAVLHGHTNFNPPQYMEKIQLPIMALTWGGLFILFAIFLYNRNNIV